MVKYIFFQILARKMTVLYKLAQDQLSKQNHYDWGLRSLNAVLRMAGLMQRKNKDFTESVVLMKVLRDMNYPKFIFEDVPLFIGLLKVIQVYKTLCLIIRLICQIQGSFSRYRLPYCRKSRIYIGCSARVGSTRLRCNE